MQSSIAFVLDGRITRIDFSAASALTPTTTVLDYLRRLPDHKGVKEGCAEGDCGACTVVLGDIGPDNRMRYRSVDSCLVFLPMLHGKQLVTVENLKSSPGGLHPVQQAIVDSHGSQCGFCTPGVIMSMFALYKSANTPSRSEIEDALTGNLCRCTGYRPIVEAAARSCIHQGRDQLSMDESRIIGLLRSIPNESRLIECDGQCYFQPRTLEEALAVLEAHSDAVLLSGGTDVALRVTKNHELLKVLIDVSAVDELKSMAEGAGSIIVGGGVVLSDVAQGIGGALPVLREALAVFGSQQIRNLATLGGNLGTASPISDTLSVLIPHGASVILQSVKGRREVPLDGYVVGYRATVRKRDELIVAVRIPKPPDGAQVRWYKVSKRKDLDIATVSAGFRLETDARGGVESIMLVYGGMAEMVKRAVSAETFLIGKEWNRGTVEEAMRLVDRDFTPIADARGSAQFRRVVARNLLMKFWSETSQGRLQ